MFCANCNAPTMGATYCTSCLPVSVLPAAIKSSQRLRCVQCNHFWTRASAPISEQDNICPNCSANVRVTAEDSVKILDSEQTKIRPCYQCQKPNAKPWRYFRGHIYCHTCILIIRQQAELKYRAYCSKCHRPFDELTPPMQFKRPNNNDIMHLLCNDCFFEDTSTLPAELHTHTRHTRLGRLIKKPKECMDCGITHTTQWQSRMAEGNPVDLCNSCSLMYVKKPY